MKIIDKLASLQNEIIRLNGLLRIANIERNDAVRELSSLKSNMVFMTGCDEYGRTLEDIQKLIDSGQINPEDIRKSNREWAKDNLRD